MKILICDDEYSNLELLKKHISEYVAAHCLKADIYATTSSKDIFETDNAFDLAFLDIQMPDIDGISVAKELKSRNQKVVIFFVTAFDEYRDEVWICTCSDFLKNLLTPDACMQAYIVAKGQYFKY